MSQRMTKLDYRITDDETVSDAVVRAVAGIEGVEPTELDTRLYHAVDPDALDRLFGRDREGIDGHVTFTYCGYEISVHADGRLLIADK